MTDEPTPPPTDHFAQLMGRRVLSPEELAAAAPVWTTSAVTEPVVGVAQPEAPEVVPVSPVWASFEAQQPAVAEPATDAPTAQSAWDALPQADTTAWVPAPADELFDAKTDQATPTVAPAAALEETPAPTFDASPAAPVEPAPVPHAVEEPVAAPPIDFDAAPIVDEQSTSKELELIEAPAPVNLRPPVKESVGVYPADEWLDNALADMVRAGVSDVHLVFVGNRAQGTEELRIQARMDSDLEDVLSFLGNDARKIMNKLKTASRIDTSSSRVPGDGLFPATIDGVDYRLRAVLLPTFDGGEKIVLRLPQTGSMKLLGDLGATNENVAAIQELLALPGGLTIIAGPVGEGKTTTAHACLMAIGTDGRSTIAVEDPVERILPGVSQMEVVEEIGMGFGDVMRFFVRADFDTLFIGEIRDAATAAAAVRMAKAGRRVVSTIHANNNVTALLRLIELAEDSPLSVLDAVNGVISQRLVRKVDIARNGYYGRTPIHEVLRVTDRVIDALIENKSRAAIREAAADTSTTFEDNLQQLIKREITNQAEARRVVGHDV
jgi:type II secretory ATPase GspE/PulE/Tfp pilus assembly ATPase PilB-like protein